jgi:hypothetical protein
MTEHEMKQSEVAEVSAHQQSDDNDARVLHSLGYKQQLTVSNVTSDHPRDWISGVLLTRRSANLVSCRA